MPQLASWDDKHVPAPSQVLAVFMAVAPEQTDAPQGVLAAKVEQAPNPSHTPVVPHVAAACRGQSESPNPGAKGWQLPRWPTRLQARHSPSQDELQHTPSAQKVDAHSAPVSQTAPFILGPQLPSTHLRPLTQSASLRHFPKHSPLAPLQENGAQTVAAPRLHPRAPSHV
ncbi:MAG: hypothetical protein ABUS79_10730 [Pseudomonadota bacterium]